MTGGGTPHTAGPLNKSSYRFTYSHHCSATVERSGTSTSGTGMAVGEGVVEAMTLAIEEEGADGLRWILELISFFLTSSFI